MNMRSRSANDIDIIVKYFNKYVDFFYAPFSQQDNEQFAALLSSDAEFAALNEKFSQCFRDAAIHLIVRQKNGVPSDIYSYLKTYDQNDFDNLLALLKKTYQQAIVDLTKHNGDTLKNFLDAYPIILEFIMSHARQLIHYSVRWQSQVVIPKNETYLKNKLTDIDVKVEKYPRLLPTKEAKDYFRVELTKKLLDIDLTVSWFAYYRAIQNTIRNNYTSLLSSIKNSPTYFSQSAPFSTMQQKEEKCDLEIRKEFNVRMS